MLVLSEEVFIRNKCHSIIVVIHKRNMQARHWFDKWSYLYSLFALWLHLMFFLILSEYIRIRRYIVLLVSRKMTFCVAEMSSCDILLLYTYLKQYLKFILKWNSKNKLFSRLLFMYTRPCIPINDEPDPKRALDRN